MPHVRNFMADVINDAIFEHKGDGMVAACLGDARWVVIDSEDQTVCLISIAEAQVVPEEFVRLAQQDGTTYHVTA